MKLSKQSESNKEKTPKFCLCLSKKPRASKTSKKHTIGGLEFFFKSSDAETAGSIKIYYAGKPYPYLYWIQRKSTFDLKTKKTVKEPLEDITDRAIAWVQDNYRDIVKELKALDTYIKIDEAIWRESNA